MMTRTIPLLLFILIFEKTAAQIHIPESPENLARLREINRDIWLPFSEAYADNDADKYLGLHAPDFIRANGGKWAGTKNLKEYAANVHKNFTRNIAANRKTTIDFTFFERAASAETASERGVYRVISTEKDSLPKFFYGQFHVFHRKIDGKWKIAVDYDSDENGSVGEAEFNAGWPAQVLTAADASSPEEQATEPEKAIRAAAAGFSNSMINGDWAAMADAYTSDGRIFPPGMGILEGREAIRAFWATSSKVTFHKTAPSEIKIVGSEAYDWGFYEGKSIGSDGKESAWKGKYIIVWREVSPGVWKMYLDIWNRVN